MKSLTIFLFVLGTLMPCHAQSGGAWSITSSTLDGGGGRSSGGEWTVTGTIGQFDAAAAPAIGGAHKFTGGFWAQLAPGQLPDQPVLTIIRFPSGDASLQWQADATGWQVETSYDLIHWSEIGGSIAGSGVLTLTANPSITRQFFRLRKL